MDPWALAYLAGHTDMNITKRYIHPQQSAVRDAMERAGGHNPSTVPGILASQAPAEKPLSN